MTIARWVALGSFALFLVSLTMPAIEGAGFPAQSGFDVLRRGAGAWRSGVIAWFANPCLIAALLAVALSRHRAGLMLALLGVALGVSSFSAEMAAGLAGRSVPPFDYAIGFYVWLLALGTAAVAASLGIVGARHASPDI